MSNIEQLAKEQYESWLRRVYNPIAGIDNKPKLTVHINTGTIVERSTLPVSCRYCELLSERNDWL